MKAVMGSVEESNVKPLISVDICGSSRQVKLEPKYNIKNVLREHTNWKNRPPFFKKSCIKGYFGWLTYAFFNVKLMAI